MCCSAEQTCSLTKTQIETKLFFDYPGDCPTPAPSGDNVVLNAEKPASSCKFKCAEKYFRADNGDGIEFKCDNKIDDRTSSIGIANIVQSNFANHQCAGALSVSRCHLSRFIYSVGVGCDADKWQ